MATVDGEILLHNLSIGENIAIMEPELTIPVLTIEVELVASSGNLLLQNISVEVETPLGMVVDGSASLINLSGIEIDAGIGLQATAEFKLPKISIEVETHRQNLAEGILVLPNLSIELEGGQACVINAELTLPDILLSADALVEIAETFETWVINSTTFSHAQYDNYNFNSYIELNGVYYGLNSAGIFALTGSTDDGAAIVAKATWGVVNLGSDQKKNVDGGYLHCRIPTALVVGLSADEGIRYPYTTTDHGRAGIHAERWKSGKGVKGVFYQPDIANVGGADFDFAQLDLVVNNLSRRAG